MAPLYDLFLLLDPAAPDERRAEIVANAQSAISDGGGEVVGVHDWGLRQMAYEIDHKAEAEYHFIQFTAPPELIEQLNQPLRITDDVIRHRIIRLDPGTPPPPGPPPARERNVIDERDRDDDDERPRSRRSSYESR
jgi:small subunit ribosomal protein S6